MSYPKNRKRKCPDPVKQIMHYVDESAIVNGCWYWMGSMDGNGYGQINIHGIGVIKASRAVMIFIKGVKIPEGIDVCHTCDNPPCVRPDHLFLGTRKQNMEDATAKGRTLSKERNVKAKLTQESADMIKKFLSAGCKDSGLAIRFGVSVYTISRIRRKKSCWT